MSDCAKCGGSGIIGSPPDDYWNCDKCSTPQSPHELRGKFWPKCAIKGCEFRACLRLKSIYCHPHTVAESKVEHAAHLQADERRGKRMGDSDGV